MCGISNHIPDQAEHERLARAWEVQRRFIALLLEGKGVDELCKTLAEMLDSGVSVEDASFQLLAHASSANQDQLRQETIEQRGTPARVRFDPQIQQMLREVESRRLPTKVSAFPRLGMRQERIIAPVMAGNQVLGYISVLDHPSHKEELALVAMEQAAEVVALALIKEREVAAVEAEIRGEYLEDLIQGSYGDLSAAQRRARHIGYPLLGQHVLLILGIDNLPSFVKSRRLGIDVVQSLQQELRQRIDSFLKASFPKTLIGVHSSSLIALIPIRQDMKDPLNQIRSIGEKLRRMVAEWKVGFTISIIYSGLIEAPREVATAYREAKGVLNNLARFKRGNQIVTVPEMGLTGLLAGVSDERLKEFVNRHLGALLSLDQSSSSKLLETLEAYLASGEQRRAAHKLSIHPNTLRYRLERIRELSGAKLEDPEVRLNLALALRIHGLISFVP